MDEKKVKEEIQQLIDKFEKIRNNEQLYKKYNEDNTKKNFILPLFRALGWDTESDEVIAEEKVSKKRVDYAFKINGVPKFYLECKPFREFISDTKYAKQAIEYAWNKSVTWAILCNFEGIRVFNAEWKWNDKQPTRNQFLDLRYNDYLNSNFKYLTWLSKESFEQDILDKQATILGKKTKKLPISKQLLADFTEYRKILSKDILKNNQKMDLSHDELDEIVQRILDRIIFIRTCEDKEIEPEKLESLVRIYGDKEKVLCKEINNRYRDYDKGYNSKLFRIHTCEEVIISNDILKQVILGTYQSRNLDIRYDFSAVNADVLGNIYEQYLGHILKSTSKRAKITNGKAHRKEQGIYYTPTYIVDYIVRNTLGERLKNRKLKVDEVKILDPACGSGSFLIKTFDVLSEYIAKKEGKVQQTKFEDISKGKLLKRKTELLKNCVFGVDLDNQAVEIAQLNLLLKLAEKRHRLPTLKENIKCGNSLIDDSIVAKGKDFDWKTEFNEVLSKGGFDIIIGNPPYERTLYLEDEKDFYSENYESAYGGYDICILFLEKGLQLLKDGGYLGFIISNKFLVSDYGKKIREIILSQSKIIKIIDLADAKRVFPDALVSTVIIILQKDSKKSNYNIKRFIADKNTNIFDEKKFNNIPLKKFVAKNGTFNVRYSIHKNTIYNKINKLPCFGELFDIRTGIMGFEYWNMEPFIHNMKKSSNDIRIATNSYITQYNFLWGKKVKIYKKTFYEPYVNINKMPINTQTKELFLTKNKIIVRGVAKKLTAMIDNQGIGFLVAVHSIRIDKKYNNKFIIGLLNSKFYNWIHKDRFYLGRIPEGSLKYPISFLKELPYPKNISEKIKQKIIEYVDKIIQLNKELNKIGDKKLDSRSIVENEINKISDLIDINIYNLFDLKKEEIEIIEKT